MQTREFTFAQDGDDEKPILKAEYAGFSIFGRSLCLVVDPPAPRTNEISAPAAKKRKKAKEVVGGIEEWFVNTRNDVPSIDDDS